MGFWADASRRDRADDMKVIEEPISVFCEAGEAQLTLLMGGYRVALTRDEARALVSQVNAALRTAAADDGEEPPASGPAPAVIVARVSEQVISWAQIAAAAERK